jgi:Zn-dependent peptidase ImmA (M78 family)
VGEATAFRQHRCPSGVVEVLVSRFHKEGIEPEDIHEFVRHVTRGMDQPDEARQVNIYAAALLMPKDLVLRSVSGLNLLEWATLYRLREAFEVSISALIIRLENLGLLYVADDKSLHRSKLEYFGQMNLF